MTHSRIRRNQVSRDLASRNLVSRLGLSTLAFGAVLVLGACSDDGRDMKLPADNQNESIMTTTLPLEVEASLDTPAP